MNFLDAYFNLHFATSEYCDLLKSYDDPLSFSSDDHADPLYCPAVGSPGCIALSIPIHTRRPPDNRKETQTAVVWSCVSLIRPGQNYLARHSERGKKTTQTEEEVGRQRQGMDRPGVRQVPEGSGEQRKMERKKKTGCKIICGAPTTLAVKG